MIYKNEQVFSYHEYFTLHVYIVFVLLYLGGMDEDITRTNYSTSQTNSDVQRTLMTKESCERACTTSVDLQCR